MKTEMEDNTTVVALTADFDDAVGERLKAVYDGVPTDVTMFCEYHRIGMAHDNLEHLRQVRDALAPYGRFKAWCDAAGFNYNAIRCAIERHEGKRIERKRTTVEATAATLPAAESSDADVQAAIAAARAEGKEEALAKSDWWQTTKLLQRATTRFTEADVANLRLRQDLERAQAKIAELEASESFAREQLAEALAQVEQRQTQLREGEDSAESASNAERKPTKRSPSIPIDDYGDQLYLIPGAEDVFGAGKAGMKRRQQYLEQIRRVVGDGLVFLAGQTQFSVDEVAEFLFQNVPPEHLAGYCGAGERPAKLCSALAELQRARDVLDAWAMRLGEAYADELGSGSVVHADLPTVAEVAS
jgi:hypothetical protein